MSTKLGIESTIRDKDNPKNSFLMYNYEIFDELNDAFSFQLYILPKKPKYKMHNRWPKEESYTKTLNLHQCRHEIFICNSA